MKKCLFDFIRGEDGAITVDFVVLTAAICLLGFTVVTTFSDDVVTSANNISSFMINQQAN